MAWNVAWRGESRTSGPFPTEWEAERHGCQRIWSTGRGDFQVVDLDPPAGLIRTLLEPNLAEACWTGVARYLARRCDRFWLHWWFRPANDHRSPFEQLPNPAGAPPIEPLPARAELGLGCLDATVDLLEPSWICPNGAAASGPLTTGTLGLLLNRDGIAWWDLHLFADGRRLFVATDGGAEHFAQVTEHDLVEMAAAGIPRDLFRKL